jgi:hypothetical protein
MTRLALVIAVIFSGCAVESTRFVAPVSTGRVVAEPARVERDQKECGAYADARPSEIRYATYVACLVSRGYRTYASLVGHGAATGLTVRAEREQDTRQVFRDLTACGSEVGTRVDMPPDAEMFMGPAFVRATAKSQAPFAQCMNRAGYSTTLHATPSAVASVPVAAPVVSPPPSVGAGPPAPAPATTPAVPVPGTPMPSAPPGAAPAPQTAPPAVAVVPPPPAARAGTPVRLGLFVDSATSPPVVIVVASGTPAGEAGVRPGDVVLRMDGTSIRSEEDIVIVLATKRPGDVVRMDLQRGQQQVTLEATLVAR